LRPPGSEIYRLQELFVKHNVNTPHLYTLFDSRFHQYAPIWCIIVVMASTKHVAAKHVRRSITLPREIAKQVETISKQRRLSDNRVLVDLIEQGIQAQKEKEKAFFELAHRFRDASDPKEVEQLGDQLGRFIFGE